MTVLVAMTAAAVVTVLVGYGSASAEVSVCLDSDPAECDYPDPGEPTAAPPITPTVVSTSPTDGATNVDRDANIKATFSEKMLKSSVSGQTVNLYEGNQTYSDLNPTSTTPPPEVSSSVSYNSTKKRATLNPSTRLKANTEYTAVVEGAGDSDGLAVKDRENNEMTTDKIWHFTTGDS